MQLYKITIPTAQNSHHLPKPKKIKCFFKSGWGQEERSTLPAGKNPFGRAGDSDVSHREPQQHSSKAGC